MKRRVINLRPGELLELLHQGKPALQVVLDREGQDFTLYYRTPKPDLHYDCSSRADVLIVGTSTSDNA
jgi:hypothetical protein